MQPRNSPAFKRVEAYRAIFLRPRSTDVLPAAEIVLADLRRVCCADRPTTVRSARGIDPIATAMNEGKREIWLRINQALHLEDRIILRLLDAAQQQAEGE